MNINFKDFYAREGKKVDLKRLPTRIKPFYKSGKQHQEILAKQIKELSALQSVLYAYNRYSILLIFQGMDAAGKDGVIKHVMTGINPEGCQVFSFKNPSAEDLQ